MKTLSKRTILSGIIATSMMVGILFLMGGHSAHAADAQPAYVPLAPITAQGVSLDTSNLTKFLISLVKLTIAASAALAVLMVIVGGVQYMSTDAFSGKSDAGKRIRNALFGFLLVMVSYLVLQTINPALVDFSVLNNDLGVSSAANMQDDSANQKVISDYNIGSGNATLQQYSFLATNKTRYSVQGLTKEDMNKLDDNSFYSLTVGGAATYNLNSEAECLSAQNAQPASKIVAACSPVTVYNIVRAEDNSTLSNGYPTLEACQAQINKESNPSLIKCTPNTQGYNFTANVNSTTYSNLTLLACQYEQTALPSASAGQKAGECIQTPLQDKNNITSTP